MCRCAEGQRVPCPRRQPHVREGEEMGVLDKAKAAAGQSATKAKRSAARAQTKRQLSQAYGELGQTTFDLAESGELQDPRLSPTVERIRSLKAQLDQQQGQPPPASEQPATTPG